MKQRKTIRNVKMLDQNKKKTTITLHITTKDASSNPFHDEVFSIQHYVIKSVSDLRQVEGFFRVLRFPPPI
jgi:hypothetical protein